MGYHLSKCRLYDFRAVNVTSVKRSLSDTVLGLNVLMDICTGIRVFISHHLSLGLNNWMTF